MAGFRACLKHLWIRMPNPAHSKAQGRIRMVPRPSSQLLEWVRDRIHRPSVFVEGPEEMELYSSAEDYTSFDGEPWGA